MVQKINNIDAFTRECKIFLDIVGYVSGFPEYSKMIATLGVSACAPSTLCRFRRHNVEEHRFANSYKTEVHSCNPHWYRSLHRHEEYRASEVSDTVKITWQ